MTAKDTIKVIIQDVLTMYPHPSFMEQMGITAFKSKVDSMPEAQATIILGKVKARLVGSK